MACAKCQPLGGLWVKTETGMVRCDCSAGTAAANTERDRAEGISHPPVLSSDDVTIFVEMLAGLVTHFPGESGARIAIGDQIRKMCRSAQEADWLVNRMGVLFKSWPGSREMRMVYCSKRRPLDGMELSGESEAYPDGIPSEAETAGRALPSPPVLRLLPGEPVSAAKSIDDTVEALAEAKSMKNIRRHVPVPDIPVLPPGQRITQADIDVAVNASRNRIAREELGL